MVNSDNDVDTLFGCSVNKYNSKKANTFVNCIVDVKSIGGIICVTYNNPESVVSMSGIEGLSEPVVLSDTAEIVLGSGNAYTVSLGEYSDANVISDVTLGGEKVTSYANGELTLTDAYKANTQKHGEQILKLKVEKDGKHYLIKRNVLVITQEIATYEEFKTAISHEKNKAKYGYYRLKNNITQDWINDGNNDDVNNTNGEWGFRGTIDGGSNKYEIKGTMATEGLIGTIGNGAVIKNITITQNEYIATRNLFGNSMVGAMLENVTINVKGKGTTALPANSGDGSKAYGGLLTGKYAQNNTFKNVTINATGTDIDTLFGSGAYGGVSKNNTFDNCKINAKSLLALAYNDYVTVVTYSDIPDEQLKVVTLTA